MNKDEANKEAKKIYEQWKVERLKIEEKAKKEGKWPSSGMDSEIKLFKELKEQTQKKLDELAEKIDEE